MLKKLIRYKTHSTGPIYNPQKDLFYKNCRLCDKNESRWSGPLYVMSYSKFFEQHKIMFEKKISVVARCCWKYNCLEWSRWNLYTSQKIFYYTHKAYMWFTLVSYQQSPKVWPTKYYLTNLSWYNLLTISKLAGFVSNEQKV